LPTQVAKRPALLKHSVSAGHAGVSGSENGADCNENAGAQAASDLSLRGQHRVILAFNLSASRA